MLGAVGRMPAPAPRLATRFPALLVAVPVSTAFRFAWRAKLRFFLGLFGVAISVGLLTAANVGVDSVAGSMLTLLTATAGNSDAAVAPKSGSLMPRGDIREQVEAVEQVAYVAPRLSINVMVTRLAASTPDPRMGGGDSRGAGDNEEAVAANVVGMDFEAEYAEGSNAFGRFRDARTIAGPAMGKMNVGADQCYLSDSMAIRVGFEAGKHKEIEVVATAGVLRTLNTTGGAMRLDERPKTVRRTFKVLGVVRQDGVFGMMQGSDYVLVSDPAAQAMQRELLDERFAHIDEVHRNVVPLETFEGIDLLMLDTISQTQGGGAMEAQRESVRQMAFLYLANVEPRMLREMYALFEKETGFDPERTIDQNSLLAFHAMNYVKMRDHWEQVRRSMTFASTMSISFKDRSQLYDVQNVQATFVALRERAEAVQLAVGFDYEVTIPKAVLLQVFEAATAVFRGIFMLFGLLAVIISGILIFSLISVSVEERVRAYAILRTIGASKRDVFRLVMLETLAVAAIGMVVGLGGGLVFTQLLLAIGSAATGGTPLQMLVTPQAIVISLAAALAVSLIAAYWPAKRASEPEIVDALRSEYSAKREIPRAARRGSLRMMLIGGSVAGFMIFLYFAQILVQLEQDVFLATVMLLGLTVVMLFGMVLFALGFQPWVEALICRLMRGMLGSGYEFTVRNLRRYQMRNTSTSLIFSLSVSLVIFIASFVTTGVELGSSQIRSSIGSDARLEVFTEVPEAFRAELTDAGFGRNTIIKRSQSWGPETVGQMQGVRISDSVGINSTLVTLDGIDESYNTVAYQPGIEFSEGDAATAFSELQQSDIDEEIGHIILCESIASYLRVEKGALVRVSSFLGRRSVTRMYRVVGVVRRLPGIDNIQIHPTRAAWSGALISHAEFDYMCFVDPAKHGANTVRSWQTTVLVKDAEGPVELKNRISKRVGYDNCLFYYGMDTHEQEQALNEARTAIEIVFAIVLIFTTIIALFGLVASMYATVLERRREIVILKALGMKRGQLFRMFAGEGVALLLASGALGSGVGYLLAYLLISAQNLESLIPTPFAVPWLPLTAMLIICVVFGVIAAWLPARRLINRQVAEIVGRAG